MTVYGRSEELVSRCVECDLAEPESLTSLGGSAPGVVDGILSPKMKHMLIFWDMHDSSMSFMSILPKTSHDTINKVYFQEHNSLYPILWVTTQYSYSKRCDTFC